MKKVYIKPMLKITEFQLEDITCSTVGVTTNANESNIFSATAEGAGLTKTTNYVMSNAFFTTTTTN